MQFEFALKREPAGEDNQQTDGKDAFVRGSFQFGQRVHSIIIFWWLADVWEHWPMDAVSAEKAKTTAVAIARNEYFGGNVMEANFTPDMNAKLEQLVKDNVYHVGSTFDVRDPSEYEYVPFNESVSTAKTPFYSGNCMYNFNDKHIPHSPVERGNAVIALTIICFAVCVAVDYAICESVLNDTGPNYPGWSK